MLVLERVWYLLNIFHGRRSPNEFLLKPMQLSASRSISFNFTVSVEPFQICIRVQVFARVPGKNLKYTCSTWWKPRFPGGSLSIPPDLRQARVAVRNALLDERMDARRCFGSSSLPMFPVRATSRPLQYWEYPDRWAVHLILGNHVIWIYKHG